MEEPDNSEISTKSKKKKKSKKDLDKEEEEKLIGEGTKQMILEFHESLSIATKRLTNKSVKFPSFLVSASLNLFNMNRKGYEKMLKEGSQPYLSVRMCQKYRASNKIRPGRHIDCYRQIVEMRGENAPPVIVQLTMDEKKVVLNLTWNTKEDTIINFELYDLGFSDFADILSRDGTEAKTAKIINQWMATETTSNVKYILQYWPSYSPCDGEQLESQLFEVINNCENINLNVYLIMLSLIHI